jgi:hypothetical protein
LAVPLLAAAQAGQITGTAVSAQSGEPLASVELTLSAVHASEGGQEGRGPSRGPGGDSGSEARTSLDGRFVFDGVEPGDYIVGASKAGYEGGGRVARRVSVTDSAPSASVSIELNRSPALEGRVVDEDGDPLANARIELRGWTMSEGRRTLRGVRSAQTDDRGAYRLYNLMAGQYLVYLHPTGLGMRQGGVLYETSSVYYPQGATPAEAAKLEIEWGAELQGVDFVAPAAGGTLVSGTLFREDGTPCGECSVAILDALGLPAATTRVSDAGRFAVQGLPPAEYSFTGRAPRGGGLAFEKAYLPNRRPVELVLRLLPGQTVSGRVSWKEPEGGEEISLERAAVRLTPADPKLAGQPKGARISAGGGFEIEAVPQGLYQAIVYGLPNGGYVSRALLGGAELPGGELRVTGDGAVTGLELLAAFDGGSLQGRVVSSDGEEAAPPNGMVILVPLRTAAASNRELMTGYSGDEGAYRFQGAPPGEYLVFAAPRNFTWDWSDPAVMADLRRRASRIEIGKSEAAEAEAPFLGGP